MLTDKQIKELKDWQVEMEYTLTERAIDKIGKSLKTVRDFAQLERLRTQRGKLRSELQERHPFGGFN